MPFSYFPTPCNKQKAGINTCHQVNNKNGVFVECRLHFKGLKGQKAAVCKLLKR